jgi:hypothetical protein
LGEGGGVALVPNKHLERPAFCISKFWKTKGWGLGRVVFFLHIKCYLLKINLVYNKIRNKGKIVSAGY